MDYFEEPRELVSNVIKMNPTAGLTQDGDPRSTRPGDVCGGGATGVLAERLSAPVSALVRDEVALATAEMKRKGAQAGVGSGSGLAVAEATRRVVSRIPSHRWVKLAGAGFLLIAFTLIARKVIR